MTAWYAYYMMVREREARAREKGEPMTETVNDGIQIAKSLTFEPDFVPYINWQALGESRRELACDMDVTQQSNGSIRVTLFWNNKVDNG